MHLFIQMKPLTALASACGEAFKRALEGGYNAKKKKKIQSDLAMQATWLLLQACARCVHAVPATTFKISYFELHQSEGICLILFVGKGGGLAWWYQNTASTSSQAAPRSSPSNLRMPKEEKSELPAFELWIHLDSIQRQAKNNTFRYSEEEKERQVSTGSSQNWSKDL